jgi:hypothetical protein
VLLRRVEDGLEDGTPLFRWVCGTGIGRRDVMSIGIGGKTHDDPRWAARRRLHAWIKTVHNLCSFPAPDLSHFHSFCSLHSCVL